MSYSRATPTPLGLPTKLAAFGVWGSNTGVGKTLVSAGICRAAALRGLPSHYVKPLQTGFPADSDGHIVASLAHGSHTLGPHAAAAAGARAKDVEVQAPDHGVAPGLQCRTLFAWREAVSPHLAALREGGGVNDTEVAVATSESLKAFFAASPPACAPHQNGGGERPAAGTSVLALVETAGGPCSPGPSGSLQADVLRPLRLPALLVADGALGGISSSVSAFESLALRGYDTPVVALIDGGLSNEDAIAEHLARGAGLGQPSVHLLPALTKPPGGGEASVEQVAAWLEASAAEFDSVLDALCTWHVRRVAALEQAADEARQVLWWPFTQHDIVGNVNVIDSRCGEHFTILRHAEESAEAGDDASAPTCTAVGSEAVLAPAFDACASWWTQGVSANEQPALARAVGYAAGRWGHVMFPENAHEAALEVSRRLLDGPGKGWASRVFFSDDGSTAMEVAFKMAFRRFYHNQGLLGVGGTADTLEQAPDPANLPQLRVIALTNSYHGDTLGTMDAQPPSVFTGPLQTPWYSPRGFFLDPPSLAMRGGEWTVELPRSLRNAAPDAAAAAAGARWADQSRAMDVETRLGTALAAAYRTSVRATLDFGELGVSDGSLPGALVLEPVLQGAGGMVLVDPLFQRVLAEECRARAIPVVFDEVFVGLFRLGVQSTASLLGFAPDVAAYAKLLTGGTVPLAVTLARESVFDAFRGATKPEALLHGHSYSAHAIGCHVACEALDAFVDPARNPNYDASTGRLRDLWDDDLVRAISRLPEVERVLALGTVFVAEVRSAETGYASTATRSLVGRLQGRGIQARPLGNVVYLMCAPTTPRDDCTFILHALYSELLRGAEAPAATNEGGL